MKNFKLQLQVSKAARKSLYLLKGNKSLVNSQYKKSDTLAIEDNLLGDNASMNP